ncbi:hypothetical protein KCP74_25850 (plasmid) [Salmonella enterica subsp. enterica]|nr:hypothetical protein KCP74_25850 [Salmonella enterica subsp. enterica]
MIPHRGIVNRLLTDAKQNTHCQSRMLYYRKHPMYLMFQFGYFGHTGMVPELVMVKT